VTDEEIIRLYAQYCPTGVAHLYTLLLASRIPYIRHRLFYNDTGAGRGMQESRRCRHSNTSICGICLDQFTKKENPTMAEMLRAPRTRTQPSVMDEAS
jgi:hypothetical protein